jgi:hypothetical protein
VLLLKRLSRQIPQFSMLCPVLCPVLLLILRPR